MTRDGDTTPVTRSPTSTTSWPPGAPTPTPSMPLSCRPARATSFFSSRGAPSPASSGVARSIGMTMRQWLGATPPDHPTVSPHRANPWVAIRPGSNSPRRRHLMPDEWEYPGSPRGISPSTASRSPTSTPSSPGANSSSCAAVGDASERADPGIRMELLRRQPAGGAWAAWLVYRIDGSRDREFLTRVSEVRLRAGGSTADADGSNLFEGGFLGMDNVGPFDRSAPPARRRPPRTVR